MDLLIAIKPTQIVLDPGSEAREPAAETLQSTFYGIASELLGHVAEAVGAPIAHPTQAEEASIPQPEFHAGSPGEPDRGKTSPGDLSGQGGRSRAERLLPDDRIYAVSPDHQVVVSSRAIGE